jgi:hypothetical protein
VAVPYFQQPGWLARPTDADLAFLASFVAPAAASVDRLDQLPARLRFLFDYSADRALSQPEVRAEAEAASAVVEALAAELAASGPMLDREAFRDVAARVRDRSGQKGKALFHPIRVVLTGETEGLELDIAVPAIDRGAVLTSSGSSAIRPILSAAERAERFHRALH